MSESVYRSGGLSAPLAALEAASNWRAVAMIIGTMVLFVLLIALGAWSGSGILVAAMTLIGLLVILAGNSATGYMLMDHATGREQRSFVDAILTAVVTLPRVLGVMLTAFLAFVAAMIVLAIVLFVCKIPGLGPILYTVVFPVSAILLGVLGLTLLYVSPIILGPAIWEGHGVAAAMARLWTIARHRLLPVLMQLFLLTLVVFFVTSLISGVMIMGGLTTAGLSLKIIGLSSINPMSMFSGAMPMLMGGGYGGYDGGMGSGFGAGIGSAGGGSGYLTALMIGAMILVAIAASLPAVIFISGACHIYLENAEGLDFAESEAKINQGVQEAKRRAAEAQARAQQAAQQAAERAQKAAEQAKAAAEERKKAAADTSAAATRAFSAHTSCPGCNAEVGADDVFCGSCGHRLKG